MAEKFNKKISYRKKVSTSNLIKSDNAGFSGLLESSLGRKGLKGKLKQYISLADWQSVVGEEIASVSKPEKIIRDKILVIKVKDLSWIQELSFKKTDILNRVNDLEEGALIEDVRFVLAHPKDFKN